MTLEQFLGQKEAIKDNLEWLLVEAKHMQSLGGTHFRSCLTKYKTVTMLVRMSYKYAEDDIKRLMTYKRAFPNVQMIVYPQTKREYCQTEFVGTYYEFKHYHLVDEITEKMVKDRMMEFVKSKLGMKSWETLDCQVMQFFKQGKITWEDVVSAHKEGCSI